MATTLTKDQFTKHLSDAIEKRSRFYSKIDGFAFQYETDDTNAQQDFKHFADILKLLGNPDPPSLFAVRRDDLIPQWTLSTELLKFLKPCPESTGRGLLLVHYAGHGWVDPDGKLMFGPTNKSDGKPVSGEKLLGQVIDCGPNPNVNVFFILDSCFSGISTRELAPDGPIIEVLAAVDGTGTAFGNSPFSPWTQYRTFTSKLADYIARSKGLGAEYIEFDNAITTISAESPTKKPTHKVLHGNTSISVSLKPHKAKKTVSSASVQNIEQYQAIFKVHLSNSLTTEDTRELSRWVRNLDPSYEMSLDGVYKTNSTMLFLGVPHDIFLRMIPFRENLVELVRSANLAGPQYSSSLVHSGARANPDRKENREHHSPMLPMKGLR